MITELFTLVAILSVRQVEPYWQYACAHTSEYAMFVCGCFISQVLGYLVGSLPFLLLDALKPTSAQRFKIQRAAWPSRAEFQRTVRDVLISFGAVILPMLITGGLLLRGVGITRDGSLPSGGVIACQIAYFFLVEDFFNYWLHRMLHTPWLYKHVHSVHHAFDAPFAITAAHAHPAEVVLLGIPTFIGPLLVSPHLYTLMLWQVFRNFEAIDIHSGYELPLSFKTVFPAYAGAAHHDFHHYMHSGNFASVFTWCDKLYDTDLAYRDFRAKRKPM